MVLIINTAIKHKNFIKSSFFARELQRYDYFSNDLYNILWPYNDSLDKMMINLIEKYYYLTKQDPATEEPLNIYELNKYFIINYVMNGYKYYLEDYRDFINNIQH
jgi:hypothetical protein